MSKKLQVIEPFFTLSVGDILELTEDGNHYTCVNSDEYSEAGKDGEDYSSSYVSSVTFSVPYAKELLKNGIVCEETSSKQEFVNIFTEIDRLLDKYTSEIKSINEDTKGCQECVKLERFTVLNNLVTLLTYLKGLKK